MSELSDWLVRQVEADGLPPPTLEHRFHPIRKWRFDLAWPYDKVACEVEGGTWIAGRHNRGAGFEKDCEKYAEAALAGWLVLRVTSKMIEDGTACRYISQALVLRAYQNAMRRWGGEGGPGP